MTSIGEVAALIGQVRALAAEASTRLHGAEELWVEAAEDLIQVLVGSEMAEVGELARLDDEVRRRFADLGEALAEIIERLDAIRSRLVGDGPTTAAPEPVPRTEVKARDGSRYPAASAWCADLLPRRVVERAKKEKTVGYVAEHTVPFISGEDGTWTPSVVARMRHLNIGRSRFQLFMSAHVEMKVATMMVAEKRKYAELTINHVPCGSRPRQGIGCHQVLERYLPEGYTLVVHGTTQQGEPFTARYEGRA